MKTRFQTIKQIKVKTLGCVSRMTYIFSGWKWCRMAQKARPFLQDVLKLVTFTPRYLLVMSWHHWSSEWLELTRPWRKRRKTGDEEWKALAVRTCVCNCLCILCMFTSAASSFPSASSLTVGTRSGALRSEVSSSGNVGSWDVFTSQWWGVTCLWGDRD